MLTDKISLTYIALTTVLFVFPPYKDVTGSNMSKSNLPAMTVNIKLIFLFRLCRCCVRGYHRNLRCPVVCRWTQELYWTSRGRDP